MPQMKRQVGTVMYDPHEARFFLCEPKSQGSQENDFLQKVRQELVKYPIFNPHKEDYNAIYGTNKRGMRQLWKKAISREVMGRLTDVQRAGLLNGQKLAKEGKNRPPKLSYQQRVQRQQEKTGVTKLAKLQAAIKKTLPTELKKKQKKKKRKTVPEVIEIGKERYKKKPQGGEM